MFLYMNTQEKFDKYFEATNPLVAVLAKIAEIQDNLRAVAIIHVAQAEEDTATLLEYASMLQAWIEEQKNILKELKNNDI